MIFDAWRKYSKNIASYRAMDSKHGKKKLSLSHQCTTRRINLFLSIIDYKIWKRKKDKNAWNRFFPSKIVVSCWSFFSEASSELDYDEVWISNLEFLLWFYNIKQFYSIISLMSSRTTNFPNSEYFFLFTFLLIFLWNTFFFSKK